MCHNNKVLADAIRATFRERIGQAVKLDAKGRPVDGRSVFFRATPAQQILYYLSLPVSSALDYLL